MIGYITGTVIDTDTHSITIDTGSLGYEILVPTKLAQRHIPGDIITLWTRLIVRDDAHELIGFETRPERSLFDLLRTVSGVGPRSALQIINTLDVPVLAGAIKNRDASIITRVPGIGKKTAEKIVIDLSDKIEKLGLDTIVISGGHHDLLDALVSMGYRERDVTTVVATIDSTLPLQESIKLALQLMRK